MTIASSSLVVLTAIEASRPANAAGTGGAVVMDQGADQAVLSAGLPYRSVYTLADLGL
jgi:orotate phosphoribosyltransferase